MEQANVFPDGRPRQDVRQRLGLRLKIQVLLDVQRQDIVDLSVPGNRLVSTCGGIYVYVMAAAVTV